MIESSGLASDSTDMERADAEVLRQTPYLDELFELAPDAIVLTTLRNARIVRINREFTHMFGYTSEEAVGRSLRDLVMEDTLEPILPEDSNLLAGRRIEREVVRRRKDGTSFHAHVTGRRIRLSDDEDGAYLIFRDITARKQTDVLFAGERRLLEVIAAGGPLDSTLDALCRLAEDVDRNCLVSILLLDKRKRFRRGAGPTLPPSYVDGLEGWPVGLGIGPCAAAAHLHQQVISLDLATDERWADAFRALALAHGMRACWSTPIKASDGRVLGTFAIYPNEPANPTPEQLSRIEQLTHLASIAIEREQSIDALQRSEQRYSLAMEAAAEGHFDADLDTGEMFVSERLNEIYDFPRQPSIVNRAEYLNQIPLHPDDRNLLDDIIKGDRVRPEWQKPNQDLFEYDCRFIPRPGEIRWLHIRGKVIRDVEGRARRRVGVAADITDRKRVEEALREQTERLQLGQAAMRMIIVDWNVTEDLFTWSDSPEWLRGPVPASGRYPLFKDQIHPEDRDRFLAARHRALETLQVQTTEFRVVRTDGEVIWVLGRRHAFANAEGKAARVLAAMVDITDRKRAEEALRRSEAALKLSDERYALAVAGSDDGIWDVDFAAQRVFVSARTRELTGMPPGPEILPLEEWSASLPLHADDVPMRIAAMEAHLTGKTPAYEGEYRLRQPDGVYRWRRLHGLCSRDADGKPLRMAGSISDIDARRRAEDALRLSEERYALALEAAEEGHFDSDLATNQNFSSARANEIYGFPRQATVANRLELLAKMPIHPDDRYIVDELSKSGWGDAAADLQEIEFRIVPRPGEIRWIHSRAKIVRDAQGLPRRRVGVVADITDRKRAEEALRESEDRFARAVAGSADGVWDIDLVAHSVYFSPRTRELCGLPPGPELVPLDGWFEALPLHPEDLPRRFAAMQAHLSGKAPAYDGEFRFLQPDGVYRWRHLHGVCVRNADGKPLRVAGSMSDVDDRRRAEEALRESEKRYERVMLAAEAGFWDWDVAADKVYISPKLLEMTGFPLGTEFASRSDFSARAPFYPGDWAKWETAVEELFASGGTRLTGEVRTIHGAETRWYALSGMCVRDPDGEVQRWTGSATYITARKRAEQALREQTERLQLGQAAMRMIIMDWNVTEDRFTWSDSPEWLRGPLPASGHYPLFKDQVHPEDRDSFLSTRHLALETLQVKTTEFRLVRTDGEVIWVLERKHAFADADGKPVRMLAAMFDITERKRAEDELRESEARFRSLTALWSDWYWRQDEHLRFTFSTAAFDPPDGYPGGSAIGKTRWELAGIVPLSCSWAEHREQLGACKPFREFEYSRPAADGTIRYVSTSGTPIFDENGEFRGYQGVARDITERKRVDEQLRSRQEMLEVAQKAARAVAFEWRVGAGEAVNRWSPDLEALHGIAPGSFDGTYRSWKKFVHPDDWPTIRAATKTAQQTGDVDARYRVLDPAGAIRWLHAKGRVFFDSEGRTSRVVGFMLDVTDRHLAEEELHRVERQLRQAQRLEALGTLAGGIAHDFNNLLGAILGYGEMALGHVRAGTRLRRDLENIVIAGERGHALVERILAFSRSGVGEQVAVHVEEVVRETLALFAAKLPRNIVIERHLNAGTAAAIGDQTQIHQVLMNLLTNALHAMPSGGTLRVSLDRIDLSEPAIVTTGSLVARDYIAMDVSDSGSGILAAIFEKIFDPFFTTKEVGVGTGLGLSLVHGIVTGLGGAVDVATTLGKGTRFTVYLPLAGDVAAKAEPRKRVERKTRRTARDRIMVIDDEEPLVRLATATLTELGYSAIGFTSSAKAIEAFLANPKQFDAIIADESMPGASGSELILKMRALRPTMPILLVSGYLSASVIDRARKAGATEVLKKPLPARQLKIALERALPPTGKPGKSARVPAKMSKDPTTPKRRVGTSRSQSAPTRRRA